MDLYLLIAKHEYQWLVYFVCDSLVDLSKIIDSCSSSVFFFLVAVICYALKVILNPHISI